MTIAICASMAFADKMLTVKDELEALGHTVYISEFTRDFVGLTEEEKAAKNRNNVFKNDAIRLHWEKIQKSDAILVLNYDRKGIAGYIGGNTLMEIGFAHVLHKKIFLMNPVPDIDLYKSEIEGTQPTILNGDLTMIK